MVILKSLCWCSYRLHLGLVLLQITHKNLQSLCPLELIPDAPAGPPRGAEDMSWGTVGQPSSPDQ